MYHRIISKAEIIFSQTKTSKAQPNYHIKNKSKITIWATHSCPWTEEKCIPQKTTIKIKKTETKKKRFNFKLSITSYPETKAMRCLQSSLWPQAEVSVKEWTPKTWKYQMTICHIIPPLQNWKFVFFRASFFRFGNAWRQICFSDLWRFLIRDDDVRLRKV